MAAMDDMELLREYATRHSEEAFATLATRHIDLVYTAALRHTRNHHQAQEVTQAVFVVLARKAGSLNPRTVLAGWLFQTARLTAANYVRGETRRVRREQEACMQSDPNDHTEESWRHVAPILNEIIGDLREKDRDAIVLRFLQGKDYRQVAAALGATEEAAQMRVSRALEKMRKMFARRGVVLSAAALGSAIAAQGTQAAPAGLAATVAAGAAHGVALTTSTLTLAEGTLKIMAWTKAKVVIGAGVVVLLAFQHHQNAVQARQITAARQKLDGQAQALAAAESQTQELEQQTAGILETERSQQQDLERLLARRKAAGQGSQSLAGARAPATLLSATLSDPGGREALRQGLLAASRARWSPLIGELKLDEAKTEKLLGIGADWGLRNLEAVAAFTEGKLAAEAAVQAEADTEREATNQIRSLLGEAGFAKYDECQQTFPARTLVQQFDKQLGPFPLSAIQDQALARVIEAEPPEVAGGLAGDFTVRQLVSPDGLDRRFQEQTESNQRILQAAAGFLSPEQVEALRLMQTFNMSSQKRNVLRLLRKL
jgi:RNA polymerase sigma factor (sigma-70 family)